MTDNPRTAEATNDDGPVVCGQRETRGDGNYECVRPPSHDSEAHYWVRLEVRA